MRKASIRRRRRPRRLLPDPRGAGSPTPAGPEVGNFLAKYIVRQGDSKPLKLSAIAALVAHFALFFIVIPTAQVETIRLSDYAPATVVKRYKPPAPPSQPKKTRKKKANPLPIPDPTPDEPEPIVEEESEVDFGDPEADFFVGLPDAPPGLAGLRGDAARLGDGGLIPPIEIYRETPDYTPDATRAGIQGDVYIEAVITVDGNVAEPKLIRGLPDEELNRRAVDSILKWRFKPGIKDGRPVNVIALFTVTFRIH